MATTNNVSLTWVPEHSFILGKKETDIVAKKGDTKQFHEPEPVIDLAITNSLASQILDKSEVAMIL